MTQRLLTPANVCLQVVDVQQSLMAKIHRTEKVAETVRLMIECARIMNIPIVANTQYKKGLGPYVQVVEEVVEDIPVFDKVEFSAAANDTTANFIKNLPESVTTMVLVGVETHICIYQTAMGLLDMGKKVWVVSDGVSSRDVEAHQAGMERLKNEGVLTGPAEMLIYELLGKAGTPEFKKVLPYIIARD